MKIIFTLLMLLASDWLYCQVPAYSYFYRVYFRDKGENTVSNFTPEELLSPGALKRRQKAGIATPDISDIPVSMEYINQISQAGFKLHCTSKWMNTALFKTQSHADLSFILGLPFVSDVKIVKTPGIKSLYHDKLFVPTELAEPPPFDRPVTMVNGYPLHNSGYDGKGILIAILDGGFVNADNISSLNDLRNRHGIRATYDFVNNNDFVFTFHTHGTAVLSVLAGKITGSIEGTAQGADYLLLRTEDVATEFPCEEDFWAAGAEFADSSGADIISSSLGYFIFDDPALNYNYSDLNGNTAFVTRAADVAASKGILVVNSAGNEREYPWKYIIFPSDGDSVLAAGAVDGNNLISYFSSCGPTSDKRIKPDNVAMGVSVPVQVDPTDVMRASGTSFSCPVLSGMAACLMQAVPRALNTDIIEALHKAGDRYNSPDSLYGFGIPDMIAALATLQDKYVRIPDKETIESPNPTTGNIEITFQTAPGSLMIEIISLSGKIMYRKEYPEFAGRTLFNDGLQDMQPGIYFIRLTTGTRTRVHKIIKTRN